CSSDLDVDGQETVSHTGTLGGMYSMMMLVPTSKPGFVFMINGAGSRARTVLGTALTKLFTAPMDERGFDDFADGIYGPRDAPAAAEAAGKTPALPDPAARKPVSADDVKAWLGTWRDPWFGEVRICPV